MKILSLLLIVFSIQNTAFSKEKVSLILSGGGARGIAQIGVLKALEEMNIEPDYIVGTSIGAIIGAMYSSGYSSSQIDSIFRLEKFSSLFDLSNEVERNDLFLYQKQLDQRNSVKLNFDNFEFEVPKSISVGTKFDFILKEIFWNAPIKNFKDFDGLKNKFRAVCADLITGNSVILSKGDIVEAVKASASIPLRFPPIEIDTMLLVDGGIKSNIPVQVAKELAPNDIIIAVNTSSVLLDKKQLQEPWNIADQVVSILIKEKSEILLKEADYIIEPKIGGHNNLDFSNLDSLINQGYKEAKRILIDFDNSQSPSKINFDYEIYSIINNSILKKGIVTLDPKHYSIDEYFLNEAKKLGYDFAKIKSISLDSNINKYKVYLDVGMLNKIEIKGKQSKGLISREITLEAGELLNTEDLLQTYKNIKNSGFFRKVNFIFDYNDPGYTLKIDYEEENNQNLFLGLNINNERYTRLNLEFYQNNILNNGGFANIRLNLGARDTDFYLNFENPRINSTFLNLKLSGYYNNNNIYQYKNVTDNSIKFNEFKREVRSEYYVERLGFKANVGTLLWKFGTLSAEYRFEKQRYNTIRTNTNEPYNLSTFKLESTIDTENKPFFPDEGLYFNFSIESNLTDDKNTKFIKSQFQFRQNFKLKSFILTPSINFGVADNLLPLPEHFSLGGQNSFYGFRQYDQRGRQLIIFNLELKYKSPIKLFFDTYFSMRYDLGSIWSSPQDINLSELNNGIGTAIEVNSPIGPISVAAGKAFYFVNNPNSVVQGPILIYFSIGTKF